MKVISLWQPWAMLMAIGAKKIETRGYPTKVRGLVAIHAAKRWGRDQRAFTCEPVVYEAVKSHMRLKTFPAYPLGAIVAFGELVECRKITTFENLEACDAVVGDGSFTAWANTPSFFKTHILPPPEPELSFGNYDAGRFAWIFQNVRAIEPIKCKGKQGWFHVEIPGFEAKSEVRCERGSDPRC